MKKLTKFSTNQDLQFNPNIYVALNSTAFRCKYLIQSVSLPHPCPFIRHCNQHLNTKSIESKEGEYWSFTLLDECCWKHA